MLQKKLQTLELVSVSIGIAIFPEDGNTLEELVRCADKEMYKLKQSNSWWKFQALSNLQNGQGLEFLFVINKSEIIY